MVMMMMMMMMMMCDVKTYIFLGICVESDGMDG